MSDRDNELDSLMMQADIANQEAKPRRTRPALDPNATNPREPFVAVPIEEGDVFSHTPGPWGVEWQRPCYWLIRDESGSGVHLPPGDAIDDPNRLLIERAPETKKQRDALLGVLEFVRSELSSECGDRGEEHGLRSALMVMIRAIDEAINNATKEEA